MFRRVLPAVALLAVLALQSSASAQWGCGGYGTNYFGWGLQSGWYTGVQGRMPPYFALHPPVYYSGQIVRIPYGASPFASPWGASFGAAASLATGSPMMSSPAAVSALAESITIVNEFYQGKANDALPAPKSKPASRRSDVSHELGVMIDNPFYDPSTKLAHNE